ncbi:MULTISPECIES: TetR/AcrR family transcriptional regulator [unclassified Acinetobacter]|uniref:TetR/AcrR family transcriptional regulator n=1 Tax=unclassified Acinetobacter TaxID=196816 RepID=UPI00244B8FDE|nr:MULTISPECIES: TetR/AcrR family transcriptional regulator [unclassified Acinetobacter]MDH0032270.1 TetR/AcrR family transcriptional regulator [Acinetobacter sp. GD04021]MDH0887556.1 TetR/AcrR family transcriptional regulator [Acinetobacter sp. GD03873]MDH1084186.1 TetR/AcrR family transcriptional regulator [Acinetobacter sp. GD03983]MDH2190830.1 TetR/AcrR family transcriptional regulator [Acinetobacter sp. GD03645]MDH2203899.1 TetR/AcrR family transcriptional regulator [Acinetobacter sp. GD0
MSKKEDIIKTALNLFNLHSYGSVGVDRIILESGVAKMTFYKYFPSKEKLIEVCLERRNENIQAEILATLDKKREDDYLGRIKAIYLWYLDWFKSDDFNGCMFQKATVEILKQYPSVARPIEEYRQWLSQLSEDLFTKVKVAEPHVLASMFINILDGMTVYAKMSQDYLQIEQSWSYIERLVIMDQSNNILPEAS